MGILLNNNYIQANWPMGFEKTCCNLYTIIMAC